MNKDLILEIKELVKEWIQDSYVAIEKAESEGNSITYNYWLGALDSYRNIKRIIDND